MTLYIPFGKDCLPAGLLVHGKLNRISMPFDAVGAAAPNLKHILDTDFADFMSLEFLETVQKEDKVATSHKKYPIYLNKNPKKYDLLPTDVFFNHHNLLDQDVRNTYLVKIDNFRRAIRSEESLVFLSTISPSELMEHGLYEYFDRPGKSTYITCDWNESDETYIEPSVVGSIMHIDIYSPIKFNDVGAADLVCRYIESLNL